MEQLIATDVNNLVSPAALANPYARYAELRENHPVHYNPLFACWMLTRYEDVSAALQNKSLSSNWSETYAFGRELISPEREALRHIKTYFSLWMQGMDAPDHTRQRNLAGKAFAPNTLKRIRHEVEGIVGTLLDKARTKGYLDIVEDLAVPLPAAVIFKLLSIPAEGEAYVRATSHTIAEFFGIMNPAPGQLERMSQVLQQGEEYLKGLIQERRRRPGDDLLSALITAEENGQVLGENELVIICTMLLFAGHETTTNLISNGTLALLRNPGELARLRQQPELIEPAVEELLRYDSPVQVVYRSTTVPLTLRGVTIPAGQNIMLVLGAANHDAAKFPEPGQLKLSRQDGRHLSFGYGPHFCLGAALARMEAHVAFTALLAGFPKLALAEENVQRRPNFALRGLERLKCTF